MLKEPRLSIPGNSVDLDKLRDELTQKLDVIRELQRELVRKDSRLQAEKVKTKQLIEERSDEQRRYEAALKGRVLVTAEMKCVVVLICILVWFLEVYVIFNFKTCLQHYFVDATANEECLAVLKAALSEQEETMEHQDTLIQQHEKNIEKAQKGTVHVQYSLFSHSVCDPTKSACRNLWIHTKLLLK